MARRPPYSKVKKENRISAKHVSGMGDVVFKGFQCLNPECENFIYVRLDEIGENFQIICPDCGYNHESGNETKFYDYRVVVKNDTGVEDTVEQGEFTIFHEDYIDEASLYKYCIICNSLKPISFFDKHSSRKSKRQGECRLCKKAYNAIKNGTRTSDQHRESAQKRRLLLDVAGNPKINSQEIEKRYQKKCFNCGKDLSNIADKKEKPLDHTLPVYYLWPLSTKNATLLCRDCNGSKSGTWPSTFYNDEQLKKLSVLTGFSYDLLSGKAMYNPKAIEYLHDSEKVDKLLFKYANYLQEIIKLRNRILKDTGFDFFQVSNSISQIHIDKANELLNRH